MFPYKALGGESQAGWMTAFSCIIDFKLPVVFSTIAVIIMKWVVSVHCSHWSAYTSAEGIITVAWLRFVSSLTAPCHAYNRNNTHTLARFCCNMTED